MQKWNVCLKKCPYLIIIKQYRLHLKTNKHAPCGYSLFTQYSFDNNKNEHDFYRSKDCIKKFYANLLEHTTEVINSEKKEILSLTKKRKNQNKKQKTLSHMETRIR